MSLHMAGHRGIQQPRIAQYPRQAIICHRDKLNRRPSVDDDDDDVRPSKISSFVTKFVINARNNSSIHSKDVIRA